MILPPVGDENKILFRNINHSTVFDLHVQMLIEYLTGFSKRTRSRGPFLELNARMLYVANLFSRYICVSNGSKIRQLLILYLNRFSLRTVVYTVHIKVRVRPNVIDAQIRKGTKRIKIIRTRTSDRGHLVRPTVNTMCYMFLCMIFD